MLTELFEIEPFICIKMDLALNHVQRLNARKSIQPTNQPTTKKCDDWPSFKPVYSAMWPQKKYSSDFKIIVVRKQFETRPTLR